MASQRQPRTGGASAGTIKSGTVRTGKAGPIETATIRTDSPAGRTKGGKAAAARAQARAAREARARAEAAGSMPEAAATSAWRQFLQRKVPEDMPAPATWLKWTALVLSLAGLGVSIYLTIVELAPAALVCSSTGIVNCENVLHSAQGHIFGIPVAYFGLAFYVYLVPLNSPWAWRRKELFVQRLRLASIIVGILFVLYLVYAELIEIGNICIWCTSVHIVTFLLFVLIVFDATFRRPPIAGATQSR
jgi:uncharacterized membrane protein